MARTEAQRTFVYDLAQAAIADGAGHVSTWAPDEDMTAVVDEARAYLAERNVNAGFGLAVDVGWTVLRIQGG